MYNIKKRAFTLVELIVVITILAILGTIAFISLQSYATNARESTRISDLGTIAKALELYRTTESSYPQPTDVFNVTYTGALAWEQGVFGEATRSKLGRISQVPLDPLTKNPYAYSLINTKQEYELGAISETLLSQNSSNNDLLTSQTYAASSYYSLIRGNYNKKIVSIKVPGLIYILGVPTLITSEINDVTVEEVLVNQSFSIQGSQTLPGSYTNNLPNGETIKDGDSFIPGGIPAPITPLIYEGPITDFSDQVIKQNFAEKIITYFGDSNIVNQESYEDIKNVTPGQELVVVDNIFRSNAAGLDAKEYVSVITVISGGNQTGDVNPASCIEMTSDNLANLNNWMNVSLGTDRDGFPDGSSEFSIGTSSLSIEEWCGINAIESYGDDLGGRVTYIPVEFGYLENLEQIIFQDHDIQELPESLTLLSNIQGIDFTGNTQLGYLARGTWEWELDGITCEANVSNLGNNMCLELYGDFNEYIRFTVGGEGPAPFSGGDIPFVTVWQSDNSGGSNNNEIIIPIGDGSKYNFDIVWYDFSNPAITGTIMGLSSETVITFPTPGKYYVSISGQYPHMLMDDFYSDAEKIVSVEQWGNVGWESMRRMFHRASNLEGVPSDTIGLEDVEDMSLVFSATTSFNQDISAWDVSNTTNMTGMFQNNALFDRDISGWNVDGVTSCFVFTGGAMNASWIPSEKPNFENCTPGF